MLCLESSFLVDWFRGEDYARAYLREQDADTRVLVPTIVLHELFVGAINTQSGPASTSAIYQALDGTEFIGFSAPAAEEAAEIRVTLADRGEKIGAMDSLIAGVARASGATLVANDEHFDRVDDLDVEQPRHD